ncbi:MAG: carbamoyltransferase HypF [Phycisphaeraceae bacterium]
MNTAASDCRHIRVSGTVQGVGFRPFVFQLATRHGLVGWVANRLGDVEIQVEGAPPAIARFVDDLQRSPPPQARIRSLSSVAAAPGGASAFEIQGSVTASGQAQCMVPEVPPDLAVCEACAREMFDSTDRRYRYPLINCVDCGPRYTIVQSMPYDRPRTSMARFEMCAACRHEYEDPGNRRFHAQPVACPVCGPQVRLMDARSQPVAGDPVREAARRLRRGAVLAIKGVGGYHLAVDATQEQAVCQLRQRKRRPDKPLALMAGSLDAVHTVCEPDLHERRLLTSPARPIVLLPARPGGSRIARSVAPGQRRLGIMLPYAPLHHLLLADLQAMGRQHPLIVLTSGNLSDEPTIADDQAALGRLAGVADFFLTHERPIHARCDDSVIRVLADRPVTMRRARGYAPQAIGVDFDFPEPVLACGGQLKSTFCLGHDQQAVISPHLGDLTSYDTEVLFTQSVAHFQHLLGIAPNVIAHDLHPDYSATRHAMRQPGARLIGVQHHHAHVAAVLAEHDLQGQVIGVAFDGSGYGPDQGIWGGEFLIADRAAFTRAAHLRYSPLPGGERAIREPWRLAVAWLGRLYGPDFLRLDLPAVRSLDRRACRLVQQMIDREMNCPQTSSMGRLFDAVSALVIGRHRVTYEGQAAVELEAIADVDAQPPYPFALHGNDPVIIDCDRLIHSIVEDLRHRTAPSIVAGRFHRSVTEMAARVCAKLRERHGL